MFIYLLQAGNTCTWTRRQGTKVLCLTYCNLDTCVAVVSLWHMWHTWFNTCSWANYNSPGTPLWVQCMKNVICSLVLLNIRNNKTDIALGGISLCRVASLCHPNLIFTVTVVVGIAENVHNVMWKHILQEFIFTKNWIKHNKQKHKKITLIMTK